jgi:hypothetical protein
MSKEAAKAVGQHMARPIGAAWVLNLYPGAAEAGGCFVSSRPRVSSVRGGPTADPERARVEAGRRARGRLRRYCAANQLNRLGTLTYAGQGCHDPRQARADVGSFFRALRSEVGGAAFPYVWVPEWHKTDHGLHLHFAIGRYVQRRKIESAWGRGFVHIKLLGDLPQGSGPVQEARKAAGYLSKYVAKSFNDEQAQHRRPAGLHRFDVAQGFKPKVVRLSGTSADDVFGQASDLMGSIPALRWSSADVEGWQGPPAIWGQWAA